MFEASKFRYLIKEHKNRIYSYALYTLHNRMDADDVTQEVLIRIWKNLGKFKMNSARAWIMKTTHNLCIDYLRKRKSLEYKHTFIDDGAEDLLHDTTYGTPEINTHHKIAFDKVQTAVEKLPENLKSSFLLYEINGLKYKEISEALGLPLNSVKVYILRARKMLQEELKEYKDE
jgi:RNA polymerase sigma-70 factor (ECF subfamily)